GHGTQSHPPVGACGPARARRAAVRQAEPDDRDRRLLARRAAHAAGGGAGAQAARAPRQVHAPGARRAARWCRLLVRGGPRRPPRPHGAHRRRGRAAAPGAVAHRPPVGVDDASGAAVRGRRRPRVVGRGTGGARRGGPAAAVRGRDPPRLARPGDGRGTGVATPAPAQL
ncbi:MAG: hypothetical protein AVDCRST_MAG06-1573, partial [uncultured Nocardioides sp.]